LSIHSYIDTYIVGNCKEQASLPLPWQNSKVKIYPIVYGKAGNLM